MARASAPAHRGIQGRRSRTEIGQWSLITSRSAGSRSL
jgi:hypothetical protein